ncbi:hypothetical protein KIH39_04770 [Telmatocola sphagniphila]|uniref:Uncharacterized protein n=1 Tax=Telmatocola sphagniphila TaxID=1123043 RepID=A0A8E6EZ05_9BACT|nr:hypothetical protein [Telmatocola sphagniphila]QVL33233.1 hypothetical protein KIH39_04770 [Telmatocola sphagniphila]
MEAKWKRRCLSIVLIIVAGMGCNPVLAPFLLGKDDTQTPSEFALKVPAKRTKDHEDAKVVVLVSTQPGISSEFIGIDRSLSIDVVRILDENLKRNKEKVSVVSAQQVEKWKSDNTGWSLLSPVEIGQKFNADYVINIEIQKDFRIYEPRTGRQLMKGQANISINAYEMAKATEEPAYKTEMNLDYPHGRLVEASDITPSKFQIEFIRKMANEIVWKFTAHQQIDRYSAD